jgi:proline racemase
VAFPLAFLVDVCQRTEGRTALVVAELIYRRTHVCRSQTVTLPAGELAELGIIRQRKNEALAMLETAGLVRIEKRPAGRSAKVTLTWKPSPLSRGRN